MLMACRFFVPRKHAFPLKRNFFFNLQFNLQILS